MALRIASTASASIRKNACTIWPLSIVPRNIPTLSIINPNRIPADTTDCPYFRKAQKYRVAWGIRHLLDNVPHKCAAPMRNQLVGHFGKTTYYRFYRQEQGLFPKAQAYIRQVFKQYGIAEEPKFERYSEEYSYND